MAAEISCRSTMAAGKCWQVLGGPSWFQSTGTRYTLR